MRKRNKAFAAVLVPFPLTLLSAFGYYLYKRAGLINERTKVKYHWVSAQLAKIGGEFYAKDYIGSLIHDNLTEELLYLIRSEEEELRGRFKRMLEFCNEKNNVFAKLLLKDVCYQSLYEGPELILLMLEGSFDEAIKADINPSKRGIGFLRMRELPIHPHLPKDREIIRLPFQEELESMGVKEGQRPAIPAFHAHIAKAKDLQWRKIEVQEGRVRLLTNSPIGAMSLIFIGQAHAGKSTQASLIYNEMLDRFEALGKRERWQPFNPILKSVNLDLGTPTVIKPGTDPVDDDFSLKKRTWSTELALKAFDKFWENKKTADIVIADIPGGHVDNPKGPIDDITEITAALGDVAIMLIPHDNKDEEEKIFNWRKLCYRLGIPIIGRFITGTGVEIYTCVTKYDKGESIEGIVGMKYREFNPNYFSRSLTEILLYDLLPAVIENRQKKLMEMINRLS